MKLDYYIEKIKKNQFYAGDIELSLSAIIFNLNISIYKLESEESTQYKHYTNIWNNVDDKNNDNIVVLFSGNNHYSLLSYDNIKEKKPIKYFENFN